MRVQRVPLAAFGKPVKSLRDVMPGDVVLVLCGEDDTLLPPSWREGRVRTVTAEGPLAEVRASLGCVRVHAMVSLPWRHDGAAWYRPHRAARTLILRWLRTSRHLTRVVFAAAVYHHRNLASAQQRLRWRVTMHRPGGGRAVN